MKRSGPLKRRKPWRRALGTPGQRFAFKLGVLTADMECVMLPVKRNDGLASPCWGQLQAAHIIPKRKLRSLGYPAEVIYSVEAGMTLCERHHNRHDSGLEHVPWDLIPERCRDFVINSSLAVLLERTYSEVRP